jgi:hypothetical protein
MENFTIEGIATKIGINKKIYDEWIEYNSFVSLWDDLDTLTTLTYHLCFVRYVEKLNVKVSTERSKKWT